jgi:transcription elongation factor Elf1
MTQPDPFTPILQTRLTCPVCGHVADVDIPLDT